MPPTAPSWTAARSTGPTSPDSGDPEEDLGPDRRAEIAALLDVRGGRGLVKRLASHLEQEPDLRRALVEEARRRGIDLPDEAVGWPAKRLLRRARGREEEARRRSNPVARDESFACAHCAAEVPPHGRTARDHCPWCLRSLHVDVVPGDRAADCGGILDPIGLERRGEDLRLLYRCRRCGAEKVNRALLDGDVPDDWEQLVAVAAMDPQMAR